MGKFRGLDVDEGWINRRFASMETAMRHDRAARRLVMKAESVQANDAVTLTGAWASYLPRSVPVPQGFTIAIVQMNVSASAVLLGSGTNGDVRVQPVVGGTNGPAATMNEHAGSVLASSGISIKLPVSGSLQLSLNAYYTGGPWQVGLSQVTLAGLVTFIRG